MTLLRIALPTLVLAALVTNACGSSDSNRKAHPEDDAGTDGGDMGPGAGGRGAGTGGRAGGTAAGGRAAGGTGPAAGGRAAGGTATAAGGAGPAAGGAGTGGAGVDAGPEAGADADAGPTADADAGPVLGEFCVFAESAVEDEVRQAISRLQLDGGVPSGAIPVALAARVTDMELFCDCSGARDLTGFECMTGLSSLRLGDTIDSLEPLKWLPKLTSLQLDYQSAFPDGIEALKQLRVITAQSAFLDDLSPIAGLTGLTELHLSSNVVTDASPLAGLVNLTDLDLGSNRITDITPLAGLTKLTQLNLQYNMVADIGPLDGLTNLAFLNLSGQPTITDFSPLVRNTGLGQGDEVYATPLVADCASFKADVATLAGRGVTVSGFPQCP